MDLEVAHAILDTAHNAVVSMDEQGRITYWNPRAVQIFGYSPEEALGRSLAETIIPPVHRAAHRRGLKRFLAEGIGPLLGNKVEIEAIRKDGGEFPVELTISALEADDGWSFHAFVQDISERVSAVAEIERLQEETKTILASAGDGIVRVDREGRVGFINPAAADMLGWAQADIVGRKLHDECHHTRSDGRPYPASSCPIHAAFRDGETHRVDDEVFWRPDGSSFPVEYVSAPVREAGEPVGAVCVFSDVTARKEIERERDALLVRVEALARTDQLTGLPNRRAWDEELRRELSRAERAKQALSVVMLDLDRFKAYNDRHGHPAGDALLRDVGVAWRTMLRDTDFVARYGGEEFAILLPRCPLSKTKELLGRLCSAMPAAQTFSAGIAVWECGESAESLIERADQALYEAKAAGRNRFIEAPAPS